jgi:hypothetical protein
VQDRGYGPVGEHPLAAAQQPRVHPEVQPVDEAGAQQGLQEVETADDVDLVMARLQFGDAPDEVAGEERRLLPGKWLGERAAGDVLGDTVQQSGERDLLRGVRPVVGEDLVGPPAEEQCVHARRLFEDDTARLRVRHRRLPPAVGESAVGVLVDRTGRLGHPVERHELRHDEDAHGVLLSRRRRALLRATPLRRGQSRGHQPRPA